ncbi:MAG: phage terminase large subunit [Elusimicrobiota bacterium]
MLPPARRETGIRPRLGKSGNFGPPTAQAPFSRNLRQPPGWKAPLFFRVGFNMTSDTIPPTDPEQQGRLLDLFSFARDVCGYKDLTRFHLGWYQELLKHRFVLLLSPRGHLKTSAVSTAYALWRLTQDRNLRVLILNEVLANAKDILSAVKAHVAKESFRELYGRWDALGNTWTAEKILIPRDKVLKEPTIAVAGVLGTIVSQHADLIIIDDPQGERNSSSSHQRKKVLSWFQQTVLPILEPDGQMIVCMTRWHQDDLAGVIKSDPGFSNWKVIEERAEWQDEQGGRRILFPERFPAAELDRIKGNMGSVAYRTQMLNDTAGQQDAPFKLEWIESGRYDKAPEGLRTFAGIDLAISERKGASRFAYCVIGLDKSGTAYVLDAFRGQIQIVDQIAHAKRVHVVHHPSLIVAESTGYQAVFGQLLRVDPEARLLPLRMLTVSDPKEARISGLAPLVESGAIRLPRPDFATWVSQLEEELINFPTGHDDMLDALVLALRAVNKQRSAPSIRYADDAPRQPGFNGLTPGLWPGQEDWT